MITNSTKFQNLGLLHCKEANTYGIDRPGIERNWMQRRRCNWRKAVFYRLRMLEEIRNKVTCIQSLRSKTQTMKKCMLSIWSRNDLDLWWRLMFKREKQWKSKIRLTSDKLMEPKIPDKKLPPMTLQLSRKKLIVHLLKSQKKFCKHLRILRSSH